MARARIDCPISAGRSAEIIRLKGGYSARRCEACTVVFAEPRPGGGALDAYYADWLFSLPEPAQVELWRGHTQRGVDGMIAALDITLERVADFGGGLGFFARALRQHAPEVHLFDMSAESRAYARTNFGADILVHDTADGTLAAGPFDLIQLNQVIEHVPDPASFARSLVDALTPGGRLIVTTPNNDMWDASFRLDLLMRYAGNAAGGRVLGGLKLIRDSWLCLDPPRHLYAFNQRSLAAAMAAAGAETVQILTRTWLDDPFGYPMYSDAPGLIRGLNRAYRHAGGAMVERLDAHRRHGNTLIGIFAAAREAEEPAESRVCAGRSL